MTDYKNLKWIATSSPHIRGNETTRSLMLDVVIAMVPALVCGRDRVWFPCSDHDGCVRGGLHLLGVALPQAPEEGSDRGRPQRRGHRYAAGLCVPRDPALLDADPGRLSLPSCWSSSSSAASARTSSTRRWPAVPFLLACYASAMTTWIDPTAAKAGRGGRGR